MEEGKKKQVQ